MTCLKFNNPSIITNLSFSYLSVRHQAFGKMSNLYLQRESVKKHSGRKRT